MDAVNTLPAPPTPSLNEMELRLESLAKDSLVFPDNAELRVHQAALLLQLYTSTGNPDFMEKAKKVVHHIVFEIEPHKKNHKMVAAKECNKGYIICHDPQRDYKQSVVWGIKQFNHSQEVKNTINLSHFLQHDPLLNIPQILPAIEDEAGNLFIVSQTIPGPDGRSVLDAFQTKKHRSDPNVRKFGIAFRQALILLTAYWHSMLPASKTMDGMCTENEDALSRILRGAASIKESTKKEFWQRGYVSSSDVETDYFEFDKSAVGVGIQKNADVLTNAEAIVHKRDAAVKNFVLYTGKTTSSLTDVMGITGRRGLLNILFNIDFGELKPGSTFEDYFEIVEDFGFRDISLRDFDENAKGFCALRAETVNFILTRAYCTVFIRMAQNYLANRNPSSAELRINHAQESLRSFKPLEDMFIANSWYQKAQCRLLLFKENGGIGHLETARQYLSEALTICGNVSKNSLSFQKGQESLALIDDLQSLEKTILGLAPF